MKVETSNGEITVAAPLIAKAAARLDRQCAEHRAHSVARAKERLNGPFPRLRDAARVAVG